ncbi:MAG: putative nek4 protein [Streblomastix strix]|uniref:non-specific serine/threonine protein kinase n=1 Tax=Streblomastix strix TaxID=222440 RepID=A0A5J4W3S1_9EUKA|nr:MAG: putative nek4 protein [Streblomastix strix]
MENSQQLLPLLLNQHGMRFNFNDFDDKYLLNNGAQGVISRVRLKSNQQFYIWKRVAYNTNEQQKSADREVDNLIRVQHKYIVKFEGSFVHNQWCYIVMEYCEGGNLRQFIDQLRYKPIKERKNQGINILYQMACALMHFHSLGIVHRDLKPENIFLDKNGNIKTGDFGLSKNLENQSNVSRAGTDTYQPAEAHLLGRMTEKSDIWALGVITTEIITGNSQ